MTAGPRSSIWRRRGRPNASRRPHPTERFALGYIIENEVKAERNLSLRRTLQGLLDRLLDAAALSKLDRAELGYRAKREIETNRYPQAIHLEPLKSAFAKLCPADEPPIPPPTTGRRRGRR